MRIYAVVLSFLVLGTVMARWDAGDLKHVGTFNFPFADGYVSTVWGAVHSEPRMVQDVKGAKVYQLKTDQFKAGKVLVSGYFDRDYKGSIQKRPVVFVIPGIFSNHDDSTCLRTLKQVSKLDFHVFCLPNPWSKVFIQARPANGLLPGKLYEEALIEYNLIKTLLVDLQAKQQVSTVHLMGFSYGAFLAAIVKSLDESSAQPLISGQTTILSPPVRMFRSMGRLDKLFDAEKERYQNTTNLQIYAVISNYLMSGQDSDLSPNSKRLAPTIVGFQAFHRNLIKSLKLLEEVKRQSHVKSRDVDVGGEVLLEVEGGLSEGSNIFMSGIGPNLIPVDTSRAKEMLDYRFAHYISSHYSNNEIDEYKQTKGDLMYWIGKNKDQRLRIMSAHDDFLNIDEDWEDLSRFLSRTHRDQSILVKLSEGGHMGYMSTAWFADLLKVSH